MDSPAFGSSTNKYKPPQKQFSPVRPHSQMYANILAITTLQRNLKIFCISIKTICSKRKRMGWQAIKNQNYKNDEQYLGSKAINMILNSQRKLAGIANTISMHLINKKIQGWNKLKYFSNAEDERVNTAIQYNSSRGHKKAGKITMVQQWKQNSGSNILDLSMENKHLKNQITRQQVIQESFYDKMSVLLDSYEKPKSQVSKKRK